MRDKNGHPLVFQNITVLGLKRKVWGLAGLGKKKKKSWSLLGVGNSCHNLILRREIVLWGLNLGPAFIFSLKGGGTPKMEI